MVYLQAVIFNVIEALLMCAGLVSISVFHPSGGGKSFRVLCWIIPLWSFLCTVGDLAGLWTASIVVLVTGLIILVVIALLVKLVVRCWQKRKSALSVYALPIHIDREDSAMQADEVVSMASVGDTESNLAVFHVNERSVLEVLPMASPALMERADHASVAQQSSSRDSAVSANCLMGAMVAMPALDAIISNGVDDPHSSESPSPTPSDVMLSHIQEDASDGSHADPFAHLSVDAGSDEDYFRKDDVANRYAAPSTAERSYTESPHSAMSRSSGYSEEGTPDAPSQHSQYTSEGNHTGRTVSTRTAV